mmetsp:Transcript_140701/g.350782  ORF Transcript_140701/g.350782 Transcript_140701/m.350782 type:complete len:272 (+) Transcript_140701:230-1045(+)
MSIALKKALIDRAIAAENFLVVPSLLSVGEERSEGSVCPLTDGKAPCHIVERLPNSHQVAEIPMPPCCRELLQGQLPGDALAADGPHQIFRRLAEDPLALGHAQILQPPCTVTTNLQRWILDDVIDAANGRDLVVSRNELHRQIGSVGGDCDEDDEAECDVHDAGPVLLWPPHAAGTDETQDALVKAVPSKALPEFESTFGRPEFMTARLLPAELKDADQQGNKNHETTQYRPSRRLKRLESHNHLFPKTHFPVDIRRDQVSRIVPELNEV